MTVSFSLILHDLVTEFMYIFHGIKYYIQQASQVAIPLGFLGISLAKAFPLRLAGVIHIVKLVKPRKLQVQCYPTLDVHILFSVLQI